MEESNLNEILEIEGKNTSENNDSDVKAKKDRGSLNVFIVLVMCLGIIGTITRSFTNIIEYLNLTYPGQLYFRVFCIVTIIFALIHIFGIIYTLNKISIIGIWIILGNFWASVFVCFVLNSTFESDVFDMSKTVFQAFLGSIIFSLLLFLKSDKKSAWTLLRENYNFDLKQRKVTQSNEKIENRTIETIAPLTMEKNNLEISKDNDLQKYIIVATNEVLLPNNENKCEIIDEKLEIQPKIKTWIFAVCSLSVIIAGIVAYWQITEHNKKEKEELKRKQIETYLQKATEAYNNQLYAVAIAYTQKIIDIDSTNSRAYRGLGYTYSNQENYEKAIEYLEKAILLNPNDSLAYLYIGDAYHNQKNYDKAIEYYSKALEINPDYVDAYCDLGFTYTIKDDYQQAKAYLQQAIKIDPTNSTGYAYLGRLYQEQKQYYKALDFYQKALEFKEDGWIYRNMSYTYNSMGDYQKQKECNIKGASLDDKYCQEWCRDNRVEWEK